MNSFNHYAYGAVLDWIIGVSVGITPIEESPAFTEVRIAPKPHRCLGFADATLETRSGKLRVHWYYKKDTIYYEVEIPKGVTADLQLPSGVCKTLEEGIYHFVG